MENEPITNIIEGKPCPLTSNQVMELGVKCSSFGFPLQKLIEIAKTVLKSDSESCLKFLEFVEKHELSRNIYKDFVHQSAKIQIYYSLAALSLSKAIRESNKLVIEKWQKEFNKYLNLGSQVKSSAEKLYQLLHGFNSYYAGDLQKAIANFNRLENQEKKETGYSVIALLGLAQSYFMSKRYDVALEYYKKALVTNKTLPTKARLGMGYCFYELEKYELAEKCFQRILNLNPDCSEAYMGLATINYKNGNLDAYFQNFKKAYKLTPNDPLIILHLCEHFILKGDHEKCLKLSLKGLAVIETMPRFLKKEVPIRDDYDILKSRFNNLIGQIYHSKSEFDEAKKYYDLAKQKGLKHNDVALSQIYTQANNLKEALNILERVFSSTKSTESKLIAEAYKTMGYLQVKLQVKPTSEENNPNFYYKEAMKYNKNDYEGLIDYSVYLNDVNDRKLALKILKKAERVVEETRKEPKAELLNNIAVYQLEEKEYSESVKVFNRSLEILKNYPNVTPEDEIRNNALYLTLNFNKAIALEMEGKFTSAVEIHKELISFNKYYIDSYVRLSDIIHSNGDKNEAFSILESAINACQAAKSNEVRVDKAIVMKCHLHHLDGNNNEARETLRKLGKNKYLYENFYELCLNYEIFMRKSVDRTALKEFLRPNRQFCIDMCSSDPNNVFAFMMLTVIFLVDKRITKEQGRQYFNQLKIAEQEFSEILYNFGVFSLIYEDYENALFCFNRYKEKTKSNKADEYLALTYFLKGDYTECLNNIKRGLILEPHNLKLRFQYAYINEKRVHRLYEEENNYKDLKMSTKYLSHSKKIYESLSKIATADYLRGVNGNGDTKERIRTEIGKIRSSSEDRDRFVQSQFSYYGTKEREIIEKEKRIKEEENRRLEELKKAKEKKLFMEQMGEDEEESEGEKAKRERRERLNRLSIEETERANEQWKIIQEQEKNQEGEEPRKKRKNNTTEKQPRKPKRERAEVKDEEDLPSEEEEDFKDDGEDEENEYENEYENESGENKKKKKKKNKDRERSDDEKDKKKKKHKKKDRKQREQREEAEQNEVKYEENSVKNEEGEDEENPFNDSQDNESSHRSEEEREKKHKKHKKEKEDKDEDEIDFAAYMI